MVRQNQPPGSTAGAIFSLVIGTVVFAIVLVFVGVFMGLKKLVVGAFRQWVAKGELEKVAVGDGSAATTVAANPVANLQTTASTTLLADETDVVRAAELKRVDLKGAYLAIRYYEVGGLAKAKLTISSKVVQKRVGSPVVQLEDRQVTSMAQAVMEFRTSAEMLMAGDGGKAVQTPVVPTPVPDAVTEEPAFEQMASSAPRSVAEVPHLKAAAVPRKKAVSRKQISYRGLLIDAGLAPRTQGDRSFNQYRVLLHDEKLGGELPLWGTDLERVLQESGAKPGDRIEASIVGETDVMIKGIPKPKTIWAVSKV